MVIYESNETRISLAIHVGITRVIQTLGEKGLLGRREMWSIFVPHRMEEKKCTL